MSDSSGHGNDGVIQGGAAWTTGRFGAGLSFNGISGRVKVADNLALEPSTVSVVAWFKGDQNPGAYSYIVAKGATGCIAASYGLYSGPAGGLMFYVSKSRGTGFTRSPDAGTGVWDGQWHMAVGTFDGSTVRLYVDGQQIGSGTPYSGSLEYLLPDSNDFFIGDYPGCQQRVFNGDVDEVSVWDGAFTAGQVQTDYAQALQTPVTQTIPLGPTGQSGPSGTGSGGGGTTNTVTPVVRGLRVSPSSFAMKLVKGARKMSPTVTISYTVNEIARSTLIVSSRHAGIKKGRRCVQAHGRVSAKSRCFYYQRAGSFTHADRKGLNSFHFTGIPGHLLTPGTYQLAVTPRVGKATGRTVTALFNVKR